MKNTLQKMLIGMSALLLVLLSLTISLSLNSSVAHASVINVNHPTHSTQEKTPSIKVVQMTGYTINVSSNCAALCSSTTTIRPNSTLPLPLNEEVDDDAYDELFENQQTKIPCALQIIKNPDVPRKLKIPLYLKYCKLRL